MPYRSEDDETDDHEWEEPSFDNDYEDDDADSTDSEPTVECPYCRVEILEICVQCPHCKEYISREDLQRRQHPLWIVLAFILCFFVILSWILLPLS